MVIGFNTDGRSAADNLLHLGAEVTVIDPAPCPDTEELAHLLGVLGAEIRREGLSSVSSTASVATGAWDLVVATGAAAADGALRAVRAAQREVPVLSTLALARHLEPEQAWLLVGSPEGDLQAVQVARATAAMLRAGGIRAAAAGGSDPSVMELVMEPERYEALVVVVTAELLAVSGALLPKSACVLRSGAGLGAVFTDVESACIYRTEDLATEDMVRAADVIEGARAIGITVGTPGLSMLGVVEDVLCDRAFVEDRRTSAAEVCTLGDLRHVDDCSVEAVLASVALARSYGVALAPIRHAIGETF